MNPDLQRSPMHTTATSPATYTSASSANPSVGIQVGSLDGFSESIDATGGTPIAEVLETPHERSPDYRALSDPSSSSWWRHNLKRSLIIVGILLLFTLVGLGTKAILFRSKKDPTINPGATANNLSDASQTAQQNPGTVTITRDLVVNNATTFEKTITIQGSANIAQDLAVKGNGSIGGNLSIVGNGDVQGSLNVAGNGTFTGTITAANFKGDGSQLTNIVASCTNCVHLQNGSLSEETGSVSISGVLDASSLQGVGVGITAINASNITSGTLSDARLSANVALLGANNAFTGGTNSFAGNVGIGTPGSPGKKLDIIGSSRIQMDNTGIGGGQLLLSSVSDTNEQVYLGYDRTDNVGLIQSIVQGSGYKPFVINPAGGNVGIGTITPAAKLDVAGSILQNGNMVCDASNNCGYAGGGAAAYVQGGNSFGATAVIGTNDNNALSIRTNSSEAVHIFPDGRVSIGTAIAIPASVLTVKNSIQIRGPSTSPNSAGDLNFYPIDSLQVNGITQWVQSFRTDTFGTGTAGSFVFYNDTGAGSNFTLGLKPNKDVVFGGNVGIGTTTPAAKLHVNAANSATSGSYVNVDITGVQTSGNITGSYYGLNVAPGFSAASGNTLGNMFGIVSNPYNVSSGTISQLFGTYITPVNSSTGSINTLYGNYIQPAQISTGTIGTIFGEYIAAPSNPSGTISNKYALVTEAGAGNVGIGTTAPITTLHIYNPGPQQARLRVQTGADSGDFFVGSSGGLQAVHIGSITNVPLAFYTNSSAPRVVIDTSGNVGIGTTTPISKLQVAADNVLPSGAFVNTQIGGNQTVGSTGAYTGLLVQPAFTANAGNTLTALVGAAMLANNSGTGTITTAYGSSSATMNLSSGGIGTSYATNSSTINASTGTINLGVGTNSSVINSSTGAITTAQAFQGIVYNQASGGSIGTGYGLYTAPAPAAGSTIATWYGAYLDAPLDTGTITNKYGLIVAPNAGNVGIGTTNPQSQLQVQATSTNYGSVTMAASIGSTTFTTSSPVTLHAGDTVIPSTTTTQARVITTTTTGTTFTVNFAFSANVAAQTFTSERPVANFTTASGNPLLTVVGGGTGNIKGVGIGTSLPSDVLTVQNDSGFAANIGINRYGGNTGSALIFRAANGTPASPTAIGSGALLGELDFRGSGTTAASLNDFNPAQIQAFTEQAFTDTARGTRLTFSTTPNNSTTVQERLRIDSNGNVGIGTISPSSKLEVSGGSLTIPATNAGATQGLIIKEGATNIANLQGLDYTGTSIALLSTNRTYGVGGWSSVGWNGSRPAGSLQVNDDVLNFYQFAGNSNTGTEVLRVSPGGNVGIGYAGATAPGLLQVTQQTTGVGTVTTNGTATLVGTDTQFLNTFKVGDFITVSGETARTITAIASNTSLTVSAAFNTTASGLRYTLTGGDRLTVLGNGNVGIGTTAPASTLDVYSNSHSAIRVMGTGDGANFSSLNLSSDEATDKSWVIAHRQFAGETNDLITYYYDGSTYQPRTTINTSGSFGIGTTNPGNLLSIGALSAADASGQIAVSTGAAGNKGIVVQGVAGQTADLLQAQDSSGAVLASIDKVGNLTVKNATINGTLSVNGHIITANASGTTTIAAGAAACTTPTVSVSGNDTAGTITITTGNGCVSTGVLGTVTFASAYGVAPRIVMTPTNANGTNLKYYSGAANTTTFTLDTNTAPTDTTTYTYNYQVLQ